MIPTSAVPGCRTRPPARSSARSDAGRADQRLFQRGNVDRIARSPIEQDLQKRRRPITDRLRSAMMRSCCLADAGGNDRAAEGFGRTLHHAPAGTMIGEGSKRSPARNPAANNAQGTARNPAARPGSPATNTGAAPRWTVANCRTAGLAAAVRSNRICGSAAIAPRPADRSPPPAARRQRAGDRRAPRLAAATIPGSAAIRPFHAHGSRASSAS
jgi:hypothetical protein